MDTICAEKRRGTLTGCYECPSCPAHTHPLTPVHGERRKRNSSSTKRRISSLVGFLSISAIMSCVVCTPPQTRHNFPLCSLSHSIIEYEQTLRASLSLHHSTLSWRGSSTSSHSTVSTVGSCAHFCSSSYLFRISGFGIRVSPQQTLVALGGCFSW